MIETHMKLLLELFLESSSDSTTLFELLGMLSDKQQWSNAHGLFDRIRTKTLTASQLGDYATECQYCFEEICAKTLYNLSEQLDPFDEDAPYWIIPNAITLANARKISVASIINIVTSA